MKVYPAKASALNVCHPQGSATIAGENDWPDDSFTFRRIADGSFTQDPAKAYKPTATSADVARPAVLPAASDRPTSDLADSKAGAPKAPPAKND